jgi:mannobiose 2-epimerase
MTALDIMEHVYQEGIDPVNGGIFYERDYVTGHTDKTKVWWAQAEAITSFFNCYQITKDEKYLDAAINVWNYVEKNVVDYEKGEWFENGKAAGDDMGAHRRDLARCGKDQKANRYKCPYHNSRTCFEIMSRVDAVLGEA